LTHPKVDTRIAPAISFAPILPNADSITAVATRSCAANWIPRPASVVAPAEPAIGSTLK
jgi:hypothetical protein